MRLVGRRQQGAVWIPPVLPVCGWRELRTVARLWASVRRLTARSVCAVPVVLSLVFGSCVVALVVAVIRRSVRKRTVNSSLINGYMFRCGQAGLDVMW